MRAFRICGFFALLGLFSCDAFHQDSPNCPPVAGLYFDVQNAEVNSKRISNCCIEDASVFEHMPFKKFLLEIDYLSTYYSDIHRPVSFSLFASCLAHSCAQNGQNGSEESLSELEIITLYDIDENHKKGQAVSDLFDIEEMDSRIGLNDYMTSPHRLIREEQSHLYLTTKPSLNDTCAFKVKIILDNGEEYTSITTPVIFQ